MKVPAELIPLNKWIAYKALLPENSQKSHIIIIVYRTETEIRYFYVTSQVEKAEIRYRDDKLALVQINKSEWPKVLTKDKCCIQCGKAHLKSIDIEKIKSLYDGGELSYIGDIPESIRQKIKDAVNSSITYTIVEQSILTCDK